MAYTGQTSGGVVISGSARVLTNIIVGGLATGGCAVIATELIEQTSISVGDTAYLRYKAVRGVLEKIVIKEMWIESNYITKYIDTLNAIYLNTDSVTEVVNEATAKALVRSYHQNKISQIDEYIESLC